MDMKEKLVEIIQDSVGGCARHWAEVIADGLIANGVTVQGDKDINVPIKWISVKDRLPEKEGNYIVHGNLGGVFGLFYDDMLSNSFKQMVTHWMPLPQPPKGE